LGFIPRGGESFEHGGFRFTVIEMDRRRIARVKIQDLRPPQQLPGTAEQPRPTAARAAEQARNLENKN
jgi:Mg2+/Co2+ transporter CorC